MLIEYHLGWRRLGSEIIVPVIAFTTLSLLVQVASASFRRMVVLEIPDEPLSVIAAGLAILLGFRINMAYQRWWEARTLWGALVNHCRNWARQIRAFTAAAPAQPEAIETLRRAQINAVIAFAIALRCHMRGQDPIGEIAAYLPAEALDELRGYCNIPTAILSAMGRAVASAADRGWFSDMRLLALENTLVELTNVLGGSERIRNTPMPQQYVFFLKVFVYAYCIYLPFSRAVDAGWIMPLVTFLITSVFLLLSQTGHYLEDPFSHMVHGLPLSALTRTIEINLRQELGETQLPAPIAVQNGVLF